MKANLFFAVIVGFLPVFLLLTYAFSTRHRLAGLRDRCRTSPRSESACAEYEAARTAFPASLIAWLFGFRAPGDSAHQGSPADR